MANNEKDIEQANAVAPAADIPDLKKKEKERKKAGAAWGSAKPGGSTFGGATGGAGAAARSAASAAASAAAGVEAGAAGGGLFGGLSGWLSTMLATTMGKALFALGAFIMVAGGALVAAALLRGGTGGAIVPELGALASNMKIDGAGGDRTAISGKGDIRFDPLAPKAAEPKKEEAPKDETAGKPAEEVPAPPVPDASGAVKDKLAHNLSGAKLSSNLGGSFGSKDIFGGAGSPNAPKLSNIGKANLSIPKANNGKLAAMKGNSRKASGSKLNSNRARTQRAFGQLRVAKGMSVAGAGASSADAASRAAGDAFDQRSSNGGELSSPGIGNGPADSPSTPGGAPDMTMPPTPPDVQGVRGDPRMDQAFKGIENMAQQAAKMKQMGTMMIAIGIIIAALGYLLIDIVWTAAIGAALVVLGLGLAAMGAMMINQANQMAAMAKQMGSTLAQSYGTGTYQEEQVNACTDEVLANGGGGCSREPYRPQETSIQQDVEAERTTPVTMEGGPVP